MYFSPLQFTLCVEKMKRKTIKITISWLHRSQGCMFSCHIWERSGSVIEFLSRYQGVASSSLTGVTVLCPSSSHINPCLVLVQPRKTCLDITEKIVDLDVKKQIKQNHVSRDPFRPCLLWPPLSSAAWKVHTHD